MCRRCFSLGASPLATSLPDTSYHIRAQDRSSYTTESLHPDDLLEQGAVLERSISRPSKWQHHQLDNHTYREEEEVEMEETGAKEKVRVLLMQVRTAYSSLLSQADQISDSRIRTVTTIPLHTRKSTTSLESIALFACQSTTPTHQHHH